MYSVYTQIHVHKYVNHVDDPFRTKSKAVMYKYMVSLKHTTLGHINIAILESMICLYIPYY